MHFEAYTFMCWTAVDVLSKKRCSYLYNNLAAYLHHKLYYVTSSNVHWRSILCEQKGWDRERWMGSNSMAVPGLNCRKA